MGPAGKSSGYQCENKGLFFSLKETIWLSCYKLVTLFPGVSGRFFSKDFHCGFMWLVVCLVIRDSIFLENENLSSYWKVKIVSLF